MVRADRLLPKTPPGEDLPTRPLDFHDHFAIWALRRSRLSPWTALPLLAVLGPSTVLAVELGEGGVVCRDDYANGIPGACTAGLVGLEIVIGGIFLLAFTFCLALTLARLMHYFRWPERVQSHLPQHRPPEDAPRKMVRLAAGRTAAGRRALASRTWRILSPILGVFALASTLLAAGMVTSPPRVHTYETIMAWFFAAIAAVMYAATVKGLIWAVRLNLESKRALREESAALEGDASASSPRAGSDVTFDRQP